MLVLAPILLFFVSSLHHSVEGQRIGQNPWANYQKFGRRLTNRNRNNAKINAKASVPALPKRAPATASGGDREGKTLRNTFPFNAAAAGHDHHHHHEHGNAAGNGRRNSQRTQSSAIQSFSPPALGICGLR